ncbi:uncharacterized protein LOC143875837 isoform X1 [Tasmannia lanceolata]|uniref:uncharacterized protein LOC143875837 isoform X1 n=2 Tax=Tasmannia lanceolata TaxID=3420 RepID=UPI004064A0C5
MSREGDIEMLQSEIARLLAENKKIREEKEAAIMERDFLQKELETKKDDPGYLSSDILELQWRNEDNLKEIQRLEKVIKGMVEELDEKERRSELMEDDWTSILLSVFEGQKELEEELEKKKRVMEVVSERVLGMIKKTAELVRGWDEENEGVGFDFEELERVEENEEEEILEIMPFAAELKAIERAFKKRELEMEEMKREMGVLRV